MSRAAALSIVLLATGCSDDLARQSFVAGLRVLAVAAEPPEVEPGDPVVLSALWASDRGDAPLFVWSHCRAPADGSVDGCGGEEIALGEGAGADRVILQAPGATGTELVLLTVCATAADGTCAGDPVVAAKRVQVGRAQHPNANPVIAAFAVTAAAPDEDYAVTLDAAAGSAEPGADGDDEALFVSWFATSGSFDEDRSFGPGPLRFETTWDPPAEAGDVTFWAVLRDGRGGVRWQEQGVTVTGD